MLKILANHNPDLQALQEKGHALAIDTNYLVVRDIPYLDEHGGLAWGAFVAKLVFEDATTVRQEDHQVLWAGPRPYGLDGQPIPGLGGGPTQIALSEHCSDIAIQHSFSHKIKENGGLRPYLDHVEKIATYVAAVCGPAMAKYSVDPYSFRDYEAEAPDSVFKLRDTLTSRAQITELAKLFENDVVAIIGLGGTGAYLLDYLAKTPVREILGFDDDKYFVHNAFRSPGRLDVSEGVELGKPKADVYQARYENFRHGLSIEQLFVDDESGEKLDAVTFAFVCVDKGSSRKRILDLLIARNIPFIDVGMGLNRKPGRPISGTVRTTYFPKDAAEQVRAKGYVPEADPLEDVYKANIQIAELNALNAALAVLRFKQIRGFYAGPEASDQLLLTLDNLSLLEPGDD